MLASVMNEIHLCDVHPWADLSGHTVPWVIERYAGIGTANQVL